MPDSSEKTERVPSRERPFVASLDMRTKLFVSVTATSCAILLSDWRALVALNALTLAYVLNLRRAKPVAAMYAATALMLGVAFAFIPAFVAALEFCARAVPAGNAETGLRRLAEALDAQACSTVLLPFMRICVSMNVFLALGLSFDNAEFVAVMRRLRLPRIVFVPLMVCCRFVPSFVNDLRELYESLRVRRRKMNFLSMLLAPRDFLRLLVVPVCVRTLRIADNLVLMCEVRRVGYERRGVGVPARPLRSRDALTLAFALSCAGAALALNFSASAP
ncbi:MAG: energy-coupling factor transporter transmembrane component T family protein [Candidatus Spyradosoma sp.]